MHDSAVDITDAQKEHIVKTLTAVKQFNDWHAAMPGLDVIDKAVVLNVLAARQELDGEGVSEEELVRILRWIQEKYIELSMIHGVVNGWLGIRLESDNDQPVFKLTKLGERMDAQFEKEARDGDADRT
jgi:hypothetical protein